MSNRTMVLVLAAVALGVGVASAGEAPLAVSPGDPEELVLIEARCPTFSWAAVDGVESYELVVYALEVQDTDAELVLTETLQGKVTAWTPSLDRCLERSGRYGWSVRAAGPEGPTDWSRALVFQVAAAPTELALEQALELVRHYLAVEEKRAAQRSHDALQESEAGPEPAAGASVDPAAITPPGTVDLLVSEGDISVLSSSDSKYTYVQLDTIWEGLPKPEHCDSPREYGRMIYRYNGNLLYICDNVGWVSK